MVGELRRGDVMRGEGREGSRWEERVLRVG